MPVKTGKGYRTIRIGTKKGAISILTSAKLARALEELAPTMTLYHGVRLSQLLEAAYWQGRKDGARETFDALDQRLAEAKKAIPHLPPGRPKKK